MLIRAARPGDAATLAEHRTLLQCEVHPVADDGAVERFRQRCTIFFAETLASGEYRSWLAHEAQEVIGSGGVLLRKAAPHVRHSSETEAKIQGMYVLPAHRNMGVGALLLRAILDHLRETGCERIVLSPAPSARSFYQRFGFFDTPMMRL